MGLPKQRRQFYGECGENTLAPYRGWLCCPLVGAVLPPLFIPFIREAHLVGGNCRIQKCESVDPLSLVIKCLGGEGQESGDLVVLTINKQPFPSGGQVNTRTVKLCRPPLPPTAVAVKCHIFHCHSLPSSIAASIKRLQTPPPHMNIAAHRRWQRLQQEPESVGRGQCLMTVMVGMAAAAGGGSASGGCGRRSMNFWKGGMGGYYDVFGSVRYNVHSGQK
jgi:hypothetical protein